MRFTRARQPVDKAHQSARLARVLHGEAAIVRRGGDVTTIGYGRAIADSRAGRSRALGDSSTERYFTKTPGVTPSLCGLF
jgi:pyruvate/2-oxoglutarate/acetoin dehydrogenase E1 component